ncbi:hypothetical protein SAMN04244560_00872 [Thermoanaerobacter thermohydrosulfuricus]|uniref:Uncharacterized protein n=1 Tax=Thermoanaerobacter thermohydrosulfuricus TaxID=1516 RepID=A0A1G7LTJ5_THETY|nr:hypothetical protein [Thermoanaerobacter thermohydrosulfuricus]SDF52878.1 hypothetical protein SAMN04244560_00872 [Thermoanaerobacter thermohydrosulfuricus]
MASKRNIEKAKKAIREYLLQNRDTKYFMLFTISTVADSAVGKELFSSLYDYEDLVPGRVIWIDSEELDQKTLTKGLGGRFLAVENPYYTEK